MDLGIEIAGDRQVELRLESFPAAVRAAIARRLGGITQRLLGQVEGAEPNRTGKLRGETRAFVSERENRVRGAVAVVAPDTSEHGKAAALEYGGHGTAQVSPHAQRLDHVYSTPINPIEVEVGAYSRRVNIAQRRYLRGSIDAVRAEALAEMREAILEAWGAG